MSESGNKAGFYYFLSIPNFIQHKLLKRSNPLNPSLTCGIRVLQPLQTKLEIRVLSETLCSVFSYGGSGKVDPSALFFHSYFSHLV